MRPFHYERAEDASHAVHAAYGSAGSEAQDGGSQYLAGGTTLLDLMKLDVMRPERVIDINDIAAGHDAIELRGNGLWLGALARMADVGDHPEVRRNYPMVAQSLQLAASAQLRTMATLGGNVLQRTRCSYFRDTSWAACNKRSPGSGCAALTGMNRLHAILGTSPQCIAAYPGDFAQALIALDASVEVLTTVGSRTMPFEELHRLPGDTPHMETTLGSGELITGFFVPAGPWHRHSLYLKIRDRESYEFALTSAAVALDLTGEVVNEARIGLGGVATKPWRAREAERSLKGARLDEASAGAAAEAAFADARTSARNKFKLELGRRTLARAILQAGAATA